MDVMAKASLEILGLIVLIFPMAYVYVISSEYSPYQRLVKKLLAISIFFWRGVGFFNRIAF